MKVFVSEYLKDFNATQAAIRSGYSEKTAHSIGHENLRKPEIRKALESYINETLDDDKLTLKREVIDKLREIAFSPAELAYDKEGEAIGANRRDSLKALELLGKYMVMFTDKQEIDVNLNKEAYDKLKEVYESTKEK